MRADVAELVRRRAGDRCEYCRIHQSDRTFPLQIDHIVARQHGGGDDPSNLALACRRCNLRKGPNVGGVDPDDGAVVQLFDPRRMRWTDHFRFEVGHVIATTAIGRVTVIALALNSPKEVDLRAYLQATGRLG